LRPVYGSGPLTGDAVLLDLVRRQYEIEDVVTQHLGGEVEFDGGDHPARWWPLDDSRRVVIDPQRAMGAPILERTGIPTRVISQSFQAEGDPEGVAALHGVDTASVLDAVRFELATAA
jgi:uncharacterized protein (DUF433 family)